SETPPSGLSTNKRRIEWRVPLRNSTLTKSKPWRATCGSTSSITLAAVGFNSTTSTDRSSISRPGPSAAIHDVPGAGRQTKNGLSAHRIRLPPSANPLQGALRDQEQLANRLPRLQKSMRLDRLRQRKLATHRDLQLTLARQPEYILKPPPMNGVMAIDHGNRPSAYFQR